MDDLQEPPEPSVLKKVLLGMTGVFLLCLIIIYFFLAEPIIGIIGSSTLEDGALIKDDIRLKFEQGTLKELQEHYAQNEHREIKACLLGRTDKQEYIVSEIYFPDINSASVVHVNAAACPEGTIADLHSHPVNKCLASEQDIETFQGYKKTYPDLLMIVMCSTNRFHVYAAQ